MEQFGWVRKAEAAAKLTRVRCAAQNDKELVGFGRRESAQDAAGYVSAAGELGALARPRQRSGCVLCIDARLELTGSLHGGHAPRAVRPVS